MTFSSIFFIFIYLPIFLVIYYLAPQRLQNIILVIGSLLFYAWGDPTYFLLMIFSSIFNYYMGKEFDRMRLENVDYKYRKYNLIFAVVMNLLILCFFKYTGFLADSVNSIIGTNIPKPELALPIGLSFYTFKNLSYLFDVYNRRIRAEKNFLLFCVYSMMFPHMVSGPIVRYTEVQRDLRKRTLNFGRLGIGSELFIKGLAKKVLLADNLSIIYSSINGLDGQHSVLTAWIGMLAYSLQLYFDFSGYSDMAIGLGKMLGFNFSKNFDYPYTSKSISEFWRRWHISLGSWFRDYVYIPLGGNRTSVPKQIRNLFIVWALTGLWHGASWNFVLWGLYYGVLLLLEKFVLKDILKKLPKPVAIAYTMFFVTVGWAFFSQTNFSQMGHYLATLFGVGASAFIDRAALYYLKSGFILFVIGILCCSDMPYRRFKKLMHQKPMAAIGINMLLLILCIAYMVYNSYTPFLYVQF